MRRKEGNGVKVLVSTTGYLRMAFIKIDLSEEKHKVDFVWGLLSLVYVWLSK